MSEISPKPWKYEKDAIYNAEGNFISDGGLFDDEDLEHIVECVNSHEKLIEDKKAISDACDIICEENKELTEKIKKLEEQVCDLEKTVDIKNSGMFDWQKKAFVYESIIRDIIKIDINDYGCCSASCINLNGNKCNLFDETLFGVNGFTRCGICHSIKPTP